MEVYRVGRTRDYFHFGITKRHIYSRYKPMALVQSQLLVDLSDDLPANVKRMSLVWSMLEACGLLSHCELVAVKPATREQLMKFHDERFVNELLKVRVEDVEDDKGTLLRYGLMFDSPLFPKLPQYVQYVAGSSIAAAQKLNQGSQLAINWFGGRHHAKKARASGFCYVNDIVLAIQELRKKFDKVVYLDLDIHHGDGVEQAYRFSDKVITMSVHRWGHWFFPGTGALEDDGAGKGKGYTFNAPMEHGLSDESLMKVITRCLMPVITQFRPDCMVIQCGADGLGSDEHMEWNLSIKGLSSAIEALVGIEIPTLLLGGGGYNHAQVARCWTYITARVLKADIQFDLLPDALVTDGDYEFWNDQGRKMVDENTDESIDMISKNFQRQWMDY